MPGRITKCSQRGEIRKRVEELRDVRKEEKSGNAWKNHEMFAKRKNQETRGRTSRCSQRGKISKLVEESRHVRKEEKSVNTGKNHDMFAKRKNDEMIIVTLRNCSKQKSHVRA